MRLVRTLENQILARKLATFLGAEGIENQLEISSNTDWGSDHYGDSSCKLWIINEDLVPKALELINEFEADPANPRFNTIINQASSLEFPHIDITSQSKPAIDPDEIITPGSNRGKRPGPSIVLPTGKGPRQTKIIKAQPFTTTFYLIMICIVIFITDAMTTPRITSIDTALPIPPQISSQIKKSTLYDYPEAYSLTDKLIKLYGYEALKSPQNLPKDGVVLYNELQKMPIWHGEYHDLENALGGNDPANEAIVAENAKASRFDKIRQGEFWRIFTPALLHSDLLHILFNMMWLFVLGIPIEQKIGARRYLLLMAIIAAFSNTCQYLMTGPNFIGFSGVVCGLLTFTCTRQKYAPWEGYPLFRSTTNFFLLFIGVVAAIESFSFFVNIFYNHSFSPNIANTAHLTGALIGLFLGRFSIFAAKD